MLTNNSYKNMHSIILIYEHLRETEPANLSTETTSTTEIIMLLNYRKFVVKPNTSCCKQLVYAIQTGPRPQPEAQKAPPEGRC